MAEFVDSGAGRARRAADTIECTDRLCGGADYEEIRVDDSRDGTVIESGRGETVVSGCSRAAPVSVDLSTGRMAHLPMVQFAIFVGSGGQHV